MIYVLTSNCIFLSSQYSRNCLGLLNGWNSHWLIWGTTEHSSRITSRWRSRKLLTPMALTRSSSSNTWCVSNICENMATWESVIISPRERNRHPYAQPQIHIHNKMNIKCTDSLFYPHTKIYIDMDLYTSVNYKFLRITFFLYILKYSWSRITEVNI